MLAYRRQLFFQYVDFCLLKDQLLRDELLFELYALLSCSANFRLAVSLARIRRWRMFAEADDHALERFEKTVLRALYSTKTTAGSQTSKRSGWYVFRPSTNISTKIKFLGFGTMYGK